MRCMWKKFCTSVSGHGKRRVHSAGQTDGASTCAGVLGGMVRLNCGCGATEVKHGKKPARQSKVEQRRTLLAAANSRPRFARERNGKAILSAGSYKNNRAEDSSARGQAAMQLQHKAQSMTCIATSIAEEIRCPFRRKYHRTKNKAYESKSNITPAFKRQDKSTPKEGDVSKTPAAPGTGGPCRSAAALWTA